MDDKINDCNQENQIVSTYGSPVNEVGNGTKFASVGINESLNPSASVVVLDLNDVGEGGGTIGEGEKLEGGWVVVVLSVDELLSLGNSVSQGHRGRRRGNLGCGLVVRISSCQRVTAKTY